MTRRPERMFWHRLALALGMSVRRAQEEIDAEEYRYWLAYHRLAPFGDDRADLRAATISATVANASGRYARTMQADDYLPRFDRRARIRRQSPEEMYAIMSAFAAAHNAAIANCQGQP